MPSHRRPPTIKAVGALQSNRLPLGTPQFDRQTSPLHSLRATSQASGEVSKDSHGVEHDPSNSDTPLPAITCLQSEIATAMAPTDEESSISRAAAKLERQNKRIEQANALTMQSQPPTEKLKPTAKAKAKVWVPYDFGGGDPQANIERQKAVHPAVQARVNTFRASSHGSSLSRPVSRVSQKTTTSTESERQNSGFLESDDFQLFTGRKGRRPYPEERPESRQITVEANFSKREISDIFGNELPGPSFMDGNPGTTNGQVQFIQHPNGDVSAHQWYASRYEWANLGHYSNIRKKTEGGLEKDRLKGETGTQALKQNTLAYFRTVVKQREALVTGLPFGPKEIATALPDARPPSTAPTGPKKMINAIEMPTPTPATHEQTEANNMIAQDEQIASTDGPGLPQYRQEPCQQLRQPQHGPRFNPALNFTPAPRDENNDQYKKDPFALTPYLNIYGGHSQYQQSMRAPPHHYYFQQQHTRQAGYGQHPQQVYNGLAYTARDTSATTPFHGYDALADQLQRVRMRHAADQQHSPASSSHSSLHVGPPHHQTTAMPGTRHPVALPTQPSTPQQTRTAARETVMKMTEHAKERTKSQANIRTVLHDPFLSQPESPKPQPELERPPPMPVVPQQPVTQASMNFSHISGLGMPLTSAFLTTLAPSSNVPFDQGSIASENNLRDSSPDSEWQRRPADAYDFSTEAYPASSSTTKKWDPKKIDEWWWSGNKFQRQEELFQCIKSSDQVSSRRPNPRSQSHIAPPVRTPHSNSSTASPEKPVYDERMTRLLVPVLENLASYVQGPEEKRRDYFSHWVKAPEWAIDRSPEGNDSFFDREWGRPPARAGRDPRYRPMQPQEIRFGSFEGNAGSPTGAIGLDRRFGFGRY